jgi:hypothetical protein
MSKDYIVCRLAEHRNDIDSLRSIKASRLPAVAVPAVDAWRIE